jgi:hypothetical protein
MFKINLKELVSSNSKMPHKETASKNSTIKSLRENEYKEHQLYQDADEDEDLKEIMKRNIKSELNEPHKRSRLNELNNDIDLNKNSVANGFNQIKTSNSSHSIANSEESGTSRENAPKKICIGRGLLLCNF